MYNFVMSVMYGHMHTSIPENVSHGFLKIIVQLHLTAIEPVIVEEILANQFLFHIEITNRFVFMKESSSD